MNQVDRLCICNTLTQKRRETKIHSDRKFHTKTQNIVDRNKVVPFVIASKYSHLKDEILTFQKRVVIIFICDRE